MTRCIFFIAVLIALHLGPGNGHAASPKNVVIMIGDGMGVSQITAGYTHKGWLELEAFKTVGLVLTHAHGAYITDSAASATAMATGADTYNGAIGVAPDTTALETVCEVARKKGMKTGIVAACSITHATPACFVAHVPSRYMYVEIAEQIARCGIDVLLGSGWAWFLPENEGGQRTDGVDLIEYMQTRGYTYVSTAQGFNGLNWADADKVLGLFAEDHMGWAQERDPSLQEMTAAALNFIADADEGFFLVVEGSQIDWAGHDKDAAQLPIEMADFDDAIGEVVRFAKRNPETLVIVTGDHETGGYALIDGSVEDRTVEARFITDRHTGTMIALFAMGPGAERFAGILSHADVGKTLLDFIR